MLIILSCRRKWNELIRHEECTDWFALFLDLWYSFPLTRLVTSCNFNGGKVTLLRWKIVIFILVFAENIECWYSLESSQRGGLTRTHYICSRGKNKEDYNVYPRLAPIVKHLFCKTSKSLHSFQSSDDWVRVWVCSEHKKGGKCNKKMFW